MNKADNNIVLAKPSGITLEQHNKDVVTESLSICQVLPASLSKYSKMVGKNLTNLLCASAEWHDEGKNIISGKLLVGKTTKTTKSGKLKIRKEIS